MGNSQENRLLGAITDNDPIGVREIVQKDPNVLKDKLGIGMSAVTRAAYLNRPHIIAALAELGANLNGREGLSPLMWAAVKGYTDCVNVLMLCGADPTITGPFNMTAADLAVMYGQYEAAWSFYQAAVKCTKSPEEMHSIRDSLEIPWVDFNGLLASLKCNIPPNVAPSFTVGVSTQNWNKIMEFCVEDPTQADSAHSTGDNYEQRHIQSIHA